MADDEQRSADELTDAEREELDQMQRELREPRERPAAATATQPEPAAAPEAEPPDVGEPDDQPDDQPPAPAVAGRSSLPGLIVLPGLALALASVAPLTPDGHSFIHLLAAAFMRHPLEGLMTLLGFGSPFTFGLVLALAAMLSTKGRLAHEGLRRLLVSILAFLHGHLILVAWTLWSHDLGVMPLSLLGFGAVSGLYFVITHARSSVRSGGITDDGQMVVGAGGPSLRWLGNWGATMVLAICAWIRLQLLTGVRLGWAIEIVAVAYIAIALLTRRRSS